MLWLTACTDEQSLHCEAPVDTIKILNHLTVDKNTFYLVLRITGWHDKTEIIELYDERPVFDQCSKSNIEPVFGDSLELDSVVSHLYLNLKNKSLDIVYSSGVSEPLHNESLKLELYSK